MSQVIVDVDLAVAEEAAAILGTTTLNDTIDASLREVVHRERRLELVTLLSKGTGFDFEAAKRAWGADE